MQGDRRPFLEEELDLLTQVRVMVALGKFAFDQLWRILQVRGEELPRPRVPFGHGMEVEVRPGLTLIASYHPSQQNTFTGTLTEEMFDGVWARAAPRLSDLSTGPNIDGMDPFLPAPSGGAPWMRPSGSG